MTVPPDRSSESWRALATRLIETGAQVAIDPSGLSAGSIADERHDQLVHQGVLGLQKLIQEMKQNPEGMRAQLAKRYGGTDRRFDDLEDRLHELAWHWFCAHFDGLPLDAERVWGYLDELQRNNPDQPAVTFLRTNRLGLNGELLDWIHSDAGQAEFASVPASLLLLGLWRVLKDLELGAEYVATRSVYQTHTNLFDVFDPDTLRASSIYVALHNEAQRLQREADRELQLAQRALRGPSQLSPYLHLLRRCFISGFDAECVILCRSLLEDSLRHAYDQDGVPVPGGLKERIDRGSEQHAYLTPSLAKDAHDVRLRANKVVHEEGDLRVDALDTVDKTLRVVNHLLAAAPDDS